MSLLKSLFGKKKQPADLPADSPAFQGEPLKAFDKYGREIQISRRDWYENVLKGNIEKAWDHPDELSNLIQSAFNDGFDAALEAPAKRLKEIDTMPERGTTYLAVHYLQTDQPAKAEAVLREYIKKHGEKGIILTNLAKAHSAQGRDDESLQTLWRGLEIDPNQDNGLLWYESIHRNKDGEAAGLAAFERVAALPGSWRPQLWLARARLQQNDLEGALAYYDQSLNAASKPVPTDLLQQMSGDLGNAGHLGEIIARVTPHYDPAAHGIQVGNNLIKANIDTGQLPAAKEILRQLHLQQRPDWQETIGYWEAELSKAACATQNVPGQEMPSVSLLWLEGPITLKRDAATADLFPPKEAHAPRICYLGSTAETADMGDGVKQQGSNNAGRFSRALPVHLAERTHNCSTAHACTLIPWVPGEHASFVLSGVVWKDEDAAGHARNGEHPNDYVIISHLQARGENWTLHLGYVRTIDAKCLRTDTYTLAEFCPHTIIEQLYADLDAFLQDEAGADPLEHAALEAPGGTELNHYLFRLEQSLAVRCYAMETSNSLGLSNPAEIINGILHTCVQNPKNVSCRLLLLRTLAALKKIDAKLVATFQNKVQTLMQEHPLSEQAQAVIVEELKEVLVA